MLWDLAANWDRLSEWTVEFIWECICCSAELKAFSLSLTLKCVEVWIIGINVIVFLCDAESLRFHDLNFFNIKTANSKKMLHDYINITLKSRDSNGLLIMILLNIFLKKSCYVVIVTHLVIGKLILEEITNSCNMICAESTYTLEIHFVKHIWILHTIYVPKLYINVDTFLTIP